MGRIRRWLRGTFKADRVETESLDTDDATVNNELDVGETDIIPNSLSIADDDVATINIDTNCMIFVSGDTDDAVGLLLAGFSKLETAALGSQTTNQGNTTLSGTTGTDGDLNIGVDRNTLYIENRQGVDPLDVRVIRFSRV